MLDTRQDDTKSKRKRLRKIKLKKKKKMQNVLHNISRPSNKGRTDPEE